MANQSKMKTNENPMGVRPVNQLMLGMGLPIIVSMVMQAMYNIVDSMFVARMPDINGLAHTGEYAVNALTLAFPVQMLFVAFGIGTGVGVGALIARRLGEGRLEDAAEASGNGIMLGVIGYIGFFLFGLFGIDAYLKSQTADENILSMGKEYLMICTLLSFGNILYAVYEKMLQSTGKSMYSTTAQLIGAIANIILDPIMIYGLFGIPAMGVAGAAWATVIGQMLNFVIAFFFHMTRNPDIKKGFRYLRLKKSVVGEIYSVGFSAIIMQALMSFMTYGINIIFGKVSAGAVTAYGIYYKIQQFIFFAGFGIRDAITPVVAFNYGMGSKKRVKEGIKYGTLYTMVIMLIGILLLQIFAHPLAQAFGLTSETENLCVLAMRICSAGFLFAGINIAFQGVFQALEAGNSSLIVSLLRLLVIPLPLAYVFTGAANAENLIWWAFPIGEIVAAAAAIFMLVLVYNKKVRPMILEKNLRTPEKTVQIPKTEN